MTSSCQERMLAKYRTRVLINQGDFVAWGFGVKWAVKEIVLDGYPFYLLVVGGVFGAAGGAYLGHLHYKSTGGTNSQHLTRILIGSVIGCVLGMVYVDARYGVR